ncbi:DCL family protein [Pseudooceanicola sp. CBS1P-1]|uniref:DUF3223 domain-containing protein n=1 Tax=Pseudooceanicola albus TaxID=2692189 RepID=A0A6L7G524_9RHOB|nr:MULTISPECIES: DCL family protein [Pseudooceanicola]MBT9385641.1 DCL family protein [Pseudooceanicola endophyticus]MXN18949.1 DUF3223 domain-containing protein [Pseudooceanicola albus]
MPRSVPVEIMGIKFRTKGDALAYLRAMLNRYAPGSPVNEEDAVFLREALKRHPEADAKIGAGISSFEVRSADYGTQCFWVLRVDQTEERFSYKSCV